MHKEQLWKKTKTKTTPSFGIYDTIYREIIHLVRSQNFPKNYYFLPLDTRTNVRVSRDKKC